ncbi:MAG: molybdopterin cofactor-binding domain-containing protein [Puniceicoccaceae bacterium]
MSQELYNYEPEAGVDLPQVVIERDRMRERAAKESSNGSSGIPRRHFLKLTGIAGGGLVLAFSLGGGSSAKAAKTICGPVADGGFQPNSYIQIKPDGTIILMAYSPEAGQGVKTFLPMIMAEELEVAWEDVTIVQSGISQEKYGRQVAGGSGATPWAWNPIREAGAAARTMLVAAAAKKWKVAESKCTAEAGYVKGPGKKKLSYGELAEAAAALPVPGKDSLKLKDRKDYKILGKFTTGVDNQAIVTGAPLFGHDIKLEGMLYAVFVKCPSFRGVPKEANLGAVKKKPGVVDAFIVKGQGGPRQVSPGVAIVAKSTFEAFEAERALKVKWDKSEASKDSWTEYKKQAKELTSKPCEEMENSGDFDAAQSSAKKVVESYYSYPYVSHAQMEPENCTAWLRDGVLEMWIPSQAPQGIPGQVAAIAGIDPSKVKLHQLRIGGGFGRKLINDFVCEAAAVAKNVDGPVQLVWTRETDMAHDHYRVGGFHNLTGCIDNKGKFSGLRDRTVIYTDPSDSRGRPGAGGAVRASAVQCPEIPNVRFEGAKVHSMVPTGWWRAPGACSLAWVFQSFIHEMAEAAGRDHVEFLLEQMGEPRWMGNKSSNAFNTERAIGVIKAAAKKGDWGKKMPKGQGRGLSFYFSHKGYFAMIAEVTVKGTNVKVDRVVSVGDVGMLLNPAGGNNQVEGSIIDAMSVMANQEITFEVGAVQEENFGGYPLLRMSAMPKIEVHWLTTDYDPTGLGEPAFPPVTAAITNAIFDASGERIRTMPISKDGFRIV